MNRLLFSILTILATQETAHLSRNIFEDRFAGYSIRLPADWVVIPYFSEKKNDLNNKGNLSKRCTIIEEKGPKGWTISVYSVTGISRFEELLREYRKVAKDPDCDLEEIMINGRKCMLQSYYGESGPEEKPHLKRAIYYTMSDDKEGGIVFDIELARREQSRGEILSAVETALEEIIFTGREQAATGELFKDIILPGWNRVETDNFIILHTTSKGFAKKVAEEVESAAKLYRTYLSRFEQKKPGEKILVRFFGSKYQYNLFTTRDSAMAFYRPLVGVIASRSSREGEKVLGVIRHEIFHAYMGKYFPSSFRSGSMPGWLNEGLAVYAAHLREASDTEGGVEQEIAMGHLFGIAQAIRSGKHVPLKLFLRGKYGSLQYQQGWSLCYFLQHYDGEGADKYSLLFQKLLEGLNKLSSNEKTTIFSIMKELDIDIEKMESDWKEYILRLYSSGSKGSQTDIPYRSKMD